MKEKISNRTSIGNTNNPHLRVVSLVAALSIPPKTKEMNEEQKFSNKKTLVLNSQTKDNYLSL